MRASNAPRIATSPVLTPIRARRPTRHCAWASHRIYGANVQLGCVMPVRQLGEEFEQTGIVQVRGAIPAADIESMAGQVWHNLERRYRFRRNQPETWTGQRVNGLHALDPSVTFEEIGNTLISQMLDELLDAGEWHHPPSVLECGRSPS